jgi:serine/threonine protein kinase
MGEVYLAEDLHLKRRVAIKLLPAEFTANPDRLRRFEQEAQAASALNHPNILTIYEFGTHDDTPYMVAELLEGEGLREQLNDGALSQRKVIDYAQQIASGLAAAHAKGIVHRDLKPENLFILTDGRVKILDFGLAKLQPSGQFGSAVLTQRAGTEPGTVMGTVEYMSPEQVRGQEADHRADIFAFGVILYEMLGGQRPFIGESAVEVMNAILKEDATELRETKWKVSPALEKIVWRCLEKKPEHRFQSASDLSFALEALSTPPGSRGTAGADLATSPIAPVGGGWRERIWMIATGVFALIAVAALVMVYFNRSSTNSHAVRLSFIPPENLAFDNGTFDNVIVSPDGQKLAFTGRSADGKRQLWVRGLDAAEAQAVPGTDDPVQPFWSPDSRSLGFFGQGKLKRVDLAGGRPLTLCNAIRFNGGSWNHDGVIIFTPSENSAVFQIPATGGEPKPVTFPDEAQLLVGHRNPYFLPDGRHFLYQEANNTFVGSLDSKEVKQVVADGAPTLYAPPGWLIFIRNAEIQAQRFDAAQLEVKGEAVSLIPGTNRFARTLPFSVSENGVLIIQGVQNRAAQLNWVDRAGKPGGTVGSLIGSLVSETPRLSPDGKRVAMAPLMQEPRNQDIWVIDLARDLPTRLTFDPSRDVNPIWSPDGSRIAYFSIQRKGIYQRAANGTGPEELLFVGTSIATSDWSSDGRFIFYSRIDEQTGRDIWVMPLTGSRQAYPLFDSEFNEYRAQLSPDAHWLAYVSNESGRYEIYVQPFTADGRLGRDKMRISTGGGNQPRWRRDGRELFYIAADDQMMAVDVQTSGATFKYGAPKALFKTHMRWDTPMALGIQYDVTADGQRFLITTMVGEAAPVSVILNWTAGLER